MKIIHTSDWHLGQQLYNYDRTEEQLSMLEQIRELVANEQPDALLISGDVFHTSSPGSSVQRMYTDALLGIHNASPQTEIVVTAGNHDSASKLEIDRSLWQLASVHVVGNIERDDGEIDYDKHIIKIGDKGFIAAVPYVFAQNFPSFSDEADRRSAFFRQLLKVVDEQNPEGLPVVLMAHLPVTGSDAGSHRWSFDSVGNIDYAKIEDFGEQYSYLALGHIHKPQNVSTGSDRVARYSGSPVAVSFDEDYEHSVSVVTLEPEQKPEVRTVAINNPHPLVTLPEEPVPFDDAIKVLQDYPDDKPCYIRLNILGDRDLPVDANERASESVKDKKCRFCTFKITREEIKRNSADAPAMTAEEFQRMTVTEVVDQYMKSKGLSNPDILSMIQDVERSLKEEERE